MYAKQQGEPWDLTSTVSLHRDYRADPRGYACEWKGGTHHCQAYATYHSMKKGRVQAHLQPLSYALKEAAHGGTSALIGTPGMVLTSLRDKDTIFLTEERI